MGPHPLTAPPPPPPPRHRCCWGLPRGCPGPWHRRRWAHQARCRWGWRAWRAGPGRVLALGSCRLRRTAEVWRGPEAWVSAAGGARRESDAREESGSEQPGRVTAGAGAQPELVSSAERPLPVAHSSLAVPLFCLLGPHLPSAPPPPRSSSPIPPLARCPPLSGGGLWASPF